MQPPHRRSLLLLLLHHQITRDFHKTYEAEQDQREAHRADEEVEDEEVAGD